MVLDKPLSEEGFEPTWYTSAKLKFALSTVPALGLFVLRPEWFEHSSKLSWAAGFTN